MDGWMYGWIDGGVNVSEIECCVQNTSYVCMSSCVRVYMCVCVFKVVGGMQGWLLDSCDTMS